MTPGPGSKVLLIGMMGSGKTSVGSLLSTRLGWPYLDNDALLQRTTGLTAKDLLDSQGEPALRIAESQVLTLLLGMPGPMIGGLAGGVVLNAPDRARIVQSNAHVVWLRASPNVLVRRIGNAAARPLLGDDPAGALRKLAAERNGLYAEIADQVVDVDVLPVGAIAKAIMAELDHKP